MNHNSPTEEAPTRDKCVKLRNVAQISNSSPSNSSCDTDDSIGASSEGVSDMRDQRQPPPHRHRSLYNLENILCEIYVSDFPK